MRSILAYAVLVVISPAHAQPKSDDSDAKAIKQAALDYIEGWYEA